MYICTPVCEYAHWSVYNTCVYIHTPVCLHTHLCVYMHTCVYIYTPVHACMRACMQTLWRLQKQTLKSRLAKYADPLEAAGANTEIPGGKVRGPSGGHRNKRGDPWGDMSSGTLRKHVHLMKVVVSCGLGGGGGQKGGRAQ